MNSDNYYPLLYLLLFLKNITQYLKVSLVSLALLTSTTSPSSPPSLLVLPPISTSPTSASTPHPQCLLLLLVKTSNDHNLQQRHHLQNSNSTMPPSRHRATTLASNLDSPTPLFTYHTNSITTTLTHPQVGMEKSTLILWVSTKNPQAGRIITHVQDQG